MKSWGSKRGVGEKENQILDEKLKMCMGSSCTQQICKLFQKTAISNEKSRGRARFAWEGGLYAAFCQLLIITLALLKKKQKWKGPRKLTEQRESLKYLSQKMNKTQGSHHVKPSHFNHWPNLLGTLLLAIGNSSIAIKRLHTHHWMPSTATGLQHLDYLK